MKQEPWCLPVTLVNAKIGSIAEITYPCHNAEMIEALARCKIPYGSGAYYHKVEEDHMDGRRKDALTKALAGTIESKAAPPTMRELNFLAAQIQCMPERKRNVLQKNISQLPASSMADVFRVVQDYSQMRVDADMRDLSARAVLTIFPAGEHKYIALLPLDENGENQDGEVFLYRFFQEEGQQPTLENIEDDDEYEIAADAFDELLDSAEYDEVVDGKEL